MADNPPPKPEGGVIRGGQWWANETDYELSLVPDPNQESSTNSQETTEASSNQESSTDSQETSSNQETTSENDPPPKPEGGVIRDGMWWANETDYELSLVPDPNQESTTDNQETTEEASQSNSESEIVLASDPHLESQIGLLPWNNPEGYFDGQLWWSSKDDYLMAPEDEIRPIAGPGPQSISEEIKSQGFFDGEFVWESEEQYIEKVAKQVNYTEAFYSSDGPQDKSIEITGKDARGKEINDVFIANPPEDMPLRGTKEYALLLKETQGESAKEDFDYIKHIAKTRDPKDYPDWLDPVVHIDDRWVDPSKINTSKTFEKKLEEYEFFRRSDGSIEIKTEEGFDEITGIPKLQFADKAVSAIAEIEATFDQVKAKDDVTGKMFRVYNAAFNRFPDSDGLEYWIEKNSSGENTERQVAESFLASSEFKEKYGEDVSNEQYVNNLYNNILGRDADADGYNYWVGQLNSGIEDRSELLLGFAESSENQLLFSEVTGLY